MDIGFAGALVGGVLTLLSPCSVMLLPAFFSYAFTSPGRLLGRTGVFFLGLAATLVPLGILAGTMGSFVRDHQMLLVTTAAVVVIALGAVQVVGLRLPMFTRQAAAESTSTVSVFLLGSVYGLAGTCAGPILGSVLTLAAVGGSPLRGGLVLLVFAAGMTLPLLVLALIWGRVSRIRDWMRPREVRIGRWSNTWTQIVGGLLSIGIGVLLIVTRGTTDLGGILGATDQYHLESWALESTDSVPDILIVGLCLAVLAGILIVHRVRAARRVLPQDR